MTELQCILTITAGTGVFCALGMGIAYLVKQKRAKEEEKNPDAQWTDDELGKIKKGELEGYTTDLENITEDGSLKDGSYWRRSSERHIKFLTPSKSFFNESSEVQGTGILPPREVMQAMEVENNLKFRKALLKVKKKKMGRPKGSKNK